MLNDYKSQLENEILSGMCFDEDYNVDTNEHFALAPQDVVKIDLRNYIQKLVVDIKAARHAPYGAVEVDEVTGKVSVNGQPVQSAVSAGSDNGSSSNISNNSNNDGSAKVDGSLKKDIIEFMMMLKKNGALEKLKGLDVDTKNRMANAVLKAIKAPIKRKPKTTQQNGEDAPDFDTRYSDTPTQHELDRDNPEFEESLVLKEAFIILTEDIFNEIETKHGFRGLPWFSKDRAEQKKLKQQQQQKDDETAGQDILKKYVSQAIARNKSKVDSTISQDTTATQPVLTSKNVGDTQDNTPTEVMPQPVLTSKNVGDTQDNTPTEVMPQPRIANSPVNKSQPAKVDINTTKLADVAKNPTSYGVNQSDPKVAYLKKLEGDYVHISKIPNVENSEILATVSNVDDDTGTIDVDVLKKKSTGADGKSQYSNTGKTFTVPQSTVRRRTPVEQIKKKGLFTKFFGG